MSMPDVPPAELPALRLLVLRTTRLELVRAFHEALGLRFAAEKHGDGPTHYAAASAGLILELYPATEDAPGSPERLGFAVGDLTASVAAVRELGAPVVRAAEATPWGVRAVVRDPDGRAVELYG